MKPVTKSSTDKDLGAVFTPERVTCFLTRWAIHSPEDVVLDPGAGNGQFLIPAANRLAELGAAPDRFSSQLHAVEYSEERFRDLSSNARSALGSDLPHLYRADLFDVEFPPIDAVVGNPPYVIRHRLADPQAVRARVGLKAGQVLRRQQTDLYSYFVIYAASFLREGGRIGLIVSDSWLDMDFGVELKTYLLHNFKIKVLDRV